jgi:dipeptidyl aminopeptidase/acylaminoacyl peptidase
MRIVVACLLCLCCTITLSSAQTPASYGVQDFIKKDIFYDIKLSPNCDYYAATVPGENKTILVILRRSDKKMTTAFLRGRNTHIAGFWWVNKERVLISVSEKIGSLDEPQSTGEIWGINVDGSESDILVGQRARDKRLGDGRKTIKEERVAATLVDDLPLDDRYVIIATTPFVRESLDSAEKMDVYTGKRSLITRAPLRNASFITDNAGNVRFAFGSGVDGINKTYYRDGDDTPWLLINDEASSDVAEWPLGFSSDNRIAYFQVERRQGPDAIVSMDMVTKARKRVLRDDDSDPESIIYRANSNTPIGAFFMDGKLRTGFFDDSRLEAQLYRGLETAFPGEAVVVTSYSSDTKLALVQTYSDRNPGKFFIFDIASSKATLLITRRDWLDRNQMAPMRPIALSARDGLALKGYLTLPLGQSNKNLPLIVLPHGGPFGVYDQWGFSDETQLLAAAGYAVLQINFRGSGNYGRAFEQAGAREWGGKMQDDLTDATRWAIAEGIADAKRVCIYGASYGAYAALMGAAKEPELYRCAVGYVGVYDLPLMYKKGDIQRRGSGEIYLEEWIGTPQTLGAVSPARLAERIKAPVFLAAGTEDERAPIAHSKLMEKALRNAGVPVETLYIKHEGHGFYVEANERAYYAKLLEFLARHLSAPDGRR